MKEIYKDDNYSVFIIEPNGNSFYFPYILCVPSILQERETLFVESNNEENSQELINSAKWTTKNILNLMNGSSNKSPIMIPILPTKGIDCTLKILASSGSRSTSTLQNFTSGYSVSSS